MKTQSIEPLPKTIKLNDLAEWSGFTERHLRDLATAGNLPPIARGELPFEAVAMLFGYLRRDSEELIRQKLLKTTADRKISEIEAEVAAGKFKSAEVFNHHLNAFGVAVNNGLTRQEKPLAQALQAAAPSADPTAITLAVQKAIDSMRAALATALENAEEPGKETV